jgi:antitoxin VapB
MLYMGMIDSKVFRSGNSEAVRLPKEVAFGRDMDVTVERRGDEVIIRPKRQSIAEMVRKLRALPAPDHIMERDADIFPDRENW